MAFEARHVRYRRGGLNRLRLASQAMLFVLAVSSLGYWTLGQLHHRGVLQPYLAEPWSPFECLYMTVVTVSTIGYTETLPIESHQTMADYEVVRGYNLFIILLAMLLVGYAVSSATAFLIEGDLNRFWQRRRSVKDAKKMSNHYIVCGCGVTGEVILEELFETHHDVVVVESDETRAEQLRDRLPKLVVMVGDAMNDDILRAAGIDRAVGLAAALPNDRDNVFLIITARRLRRNGFRIVSLASSNDVRDKLFAAGADGVVSASHIGGLRLASELFRPAVVGFLDTMLRGRSDAVRFAQVTVGPSWNQKTLQDLDLPGRFGLPVLAFQLSNEEEMAFNPPADTMLRTGSIVVTMGDASKVSQVEKLAASGGAHQA